ncbi:hypothetical protein [Rhizobium sp. LjRoot254]|uniref:hypothetical protein n=1 Tax=Rhizobium sp. LjRoot254 TaxID=3342297 RepID=UPI003ECFEB78
MGDIPARQAAAEWWSVHGFSVKGAPLPALRQQFGLSALDAIEALKLGNALGRARALR